MSSARKEPSEMARFDVFNGDADGLCALHQLRLSEPCVSQLVTGVKRDIALLDRVQAVQGDQVVALDISIDKNVPALQRLLDGGTRVQWFDHHQCDRAPTHPLLDKHIDTSPKLCTSLIVSRYLGDRHLPWAVVAAFGDNLH